MSYNDVKSESSPEVSPDVFKPSKETVLNRFAHQLGPQRTAAHLLSHLGDAAVIKPFSVGDEPTWKEVLVYLLHYNPQITVKDVISNLHSTENSHGEVIHRRG